MWRSRAILIINAIIRSWSCAYLTKHYAMKVYGDVNTQIQVFLTSALVAGEWLASRPGLSGQQGTLVMLMQRLYRFDMFS
jgi:hypothetical protein